MTSPPQNGTVPQPAGPGPLQEALGGGAGSPKSVSVCLFPGPTSQDSKPCACWERGPPSSALESALLCFPEVSHALLNTLSASQLVRDLKERSALESLLLS